MPNPPAGWYDDPADSGNSERFWDGDQWTEQVRPVAPPQPAPAPPPPAPAAPDPVPPPAPAVVESPGFGGPVTPDPASSGIGLGDATAIMPVGGGYDLPAADPAIPPAPGGAEVAVPPAPGGADAGMPPAPGGAEVAIPPVPGGADAGMPPAPGGAEVEVPSALGGAEIAVPPVPGGADAGMPPAPAADPAIPPAPGGGDPAVPPAPGGVDAAVPPAPGGEVVSSFAGGDPAVPPVPSVDVAAAPDFMAQAAAEAPPAPDYGAVPPAPGPGPGVPPTPDAGGPPAPMGSTAPVGAGGFGGIRTDLLTDAKYSERDTNERVTLQNAKMLKVELGADVLARQGSMVAFQGSIEFDYEGSGGVGKFLKKAVTGEGLPLMRCSGQGELFLADSASDIHIIHLDGAALTVNGRNILAFEPSLKWDIEQIKGVGVLAGGLFNTRLEGHGWVAIMTDGPPVVLKTDQATFADADAAVAWSANLATSINRTVKAKALIGRGSGEAAQLAFQGQGIVIVQPSEGQSVPPHSH